jgi:hypothetical protein
VDIGNDFRDPQPAARVLDIEIHDVISQVLCPSRHQHLLLSKTIGYPKD